MEQILPKVKVMEVYWSHDDHQNQFAMQSSHGGGHHGVTYGQ